MCIRDRYTAAEKFGMNKFIGMAVGAAMIHPSVAGLKSAEVMYTVFEGTVFSSNITATFCGIPVLLMNYSSTAVSYTHLDVYKRQRTKP